MKGFKLFHIIRTGILILFVILIYILAPKLVFNDSLENWIPPESDIISNYKKFLQSFNTDAFVLITIEDSVVSTESTINPEVKILMEKIGQLENVENVNYWPPQFLKTKTPFSREFQSFYFTFLPPSHLNPNRPELLEKVSSILDESGFTYHMAGTGVMHKAVNEVAKNSAIKFFLIGIVLVVVLLFLFLRDFKIIIKSIAISISSIGTAIVVASLLKIEFNMIMSILPALILFYSTSVSVHIFNHDGDIRIVFWPTLISILTTCAGFSAFLFDAAPLLQDFGILAISGLLGCLLWSLFLFYPKHDLNSKRYKVKEKLYLIEKRWTSRSIIIGIVVFTFLLPGVFMIKSDIKNLAMLPKNHKAAVDYLFIENNAGTIFPVEYQVDLKNTSSKEVRTWMQEVYKIDNIGSMISYLDIPFMASPRQLGYISKDGNTGRVVFLVPILSTSEGYALVSRIDSVASEVFIQSASVPKPTGSVTLYTSIAGHITDSFRKSLVLGFIFVFVIILIFLRSFRLFLAVLLPNIFPVIALLGVMGWLKMPLDMITVPMGCLALGIVVDASVHILYWYRKSNDVQFSIERAGPGIIITSLIYILGFSVFLVSDTLPIRHFGILSITSMLSAALINLYIMPVVLRRVKKNTGLIE